MRAAVSSGKMARLVRDELNLRIAAGGEFTAYDITLQLRHLHPDLSIMHAEVRARVHRLMAKAILSGRYQAAFCSFGGRTAIVYTPVPVVTLPSIPLLPLN